MKLLRVIATLDPRHGGPAAGLRAITPALSALGHETTFVCLDDPAEVAPVCAGATVHALGRARGGYAFAPKLEPWLRANAHEYDAVFVHGLWQYHGRAVRSVLRDTNTPYFVFPHGMLDPWFRRAYPLKHAKKWAYWQLCERHVLRDAAAVFFTCEEERKLARESFHPYACRERVVAYGTAAPSGNPARERAEWATFVPALAGQPFWLFLGRVHPKKGVDLLLRAYGQLGRETPSALPALVIAGPWSDAAYRESLDALVAQLPPNCRVIWAGMLEGARKWGALRTAEAFILPSHQENFGIAVVEALAVGTPVLISRQVNIWEEISTARAGLAEPDTLEGTSQLLTRWQSTPPAERERASANAAALFLQRYEIGRVAHSLIETVTPFVTRSTSLSAA